MNAAASFLLAYALNALWQVPLALAIAHLAARMVRGRNLRLEHRIWSAAMLLSALLPLCNSAVRKAIAVAWYALTGAMPEGNVTVTLGTSTALTPGGPHAALPPGVWLSAAAALTLLLLFFAVRLVWNLLRTWELVRCSVPAALTPEQALAVQQGAVRFGIRDVCVAISEDVFGPVTIGLLHPSILVPGGLVDNVASDDFAAAVAHECAHIRRHDFARNIAFELLALPIAWHPLLPLLRARLAESREMLCDALAADALGSPDNYARSLLRLASQLASERPVRTLHAIGIFDTGSFERRVMQLTHRPMELRGVRRIAVAAGCTALATLATASAFALHVEGPVVASPSQAAARPMPDAQYAELTREYASARATYSELAPHAQPLPAPHAPAATPAPAPRRAGPAPAAAPAPVPEPQSADQARTVPGDVMVQNLVWKKQPVYPEIARKAKVSGAVMLHAIIGADGAPKSLQAFSGPEMLKGAAIEAVKDWRWKPYLLNGQPTEVDTVITVNFSLSE